MIRRRRPIARRSAPIKRSRPRRQRKGKRASLARQADALWSQIVRRPGVCHFAGKQINGKWHVCGGSLQAMHGIPRTYRATRWLPINGWPGCAAVHYYYTVRKEEWGHFLVNEWGEPVFNELWRVARKMEKQDLRVVVSKLTSEMEANS